MAWVYLLFAGLFEAGWALGLKFTQGFTQPLPTAITLVLMVLSFGLLAKAMETLPVGTAYAVWTGIGTVLVAIVGMVVLGEQVSTIRVTSLCLVIVGLVGLKLT